MTINIISLLLFEFSQGGWIQTLVPACVGVSYLHQMFHAPMTQRHLVPDLDESASLSRRTGRHMPKNNEYHVTLHLDCRHCVDLSAL